MHHRLGLESELPQLRRERERVRLGLVVGKVQHLPEESVQAAWQDVFALHVEHPLQRLRLVRLERQLEAGRLRVPEVPLVLALLHQRLELEDAASASSLRAALPVGFPTTCASSPISTRTCICICTCICISTARAAPCQIYYFRAIVSVLPIPVRLAEAVYVLAVLHAALVGVRGRAVVGPVLPFSVVSSA
eukprot:scaffold388_cov244-Pinguiococcus_pyrenoidosus.AAC.37